ncbi:MAG: UvrD-helicase domain-containing protein [Bryobacterales bacterium]|nr:UvrD-helicase domain-containing protein [Bryobacterales bacterium]
MRAAGVVSDAQARERIRTSLDESLIIEASAGTGKTTELVQRIVNVLRSGRTTIDRIVAVTFTTKAAGELKLRLRQELDRCRGTSADPDERRYLEHALAHLEEAAIGTIHAFCAQILRERPVEAQVDPDFEELDEAGARRVYAGVFRRWMQRKLNEDSPGVRRALGRLAAEKDRDATPMEALQNAGWTLLEWRDFPRPWERPPFDRQEVLDQVAGFVESLRPKLKEIRDQWLKEPVLDALPWVERKPRDYDMLEGVLFRIWRRWRSQTKLPGEGMRQLLAVLEDFRPVANADLASRLREELWELVSLYDEAKRRGGQLDFVDLLLKVRNLVRDTQDVRLYLQQKYTHLFVDEFQDTDPLQAEILLLLSAEDEAQANWMNVTPVPGKLFLVGDPKQSIYKFRRADVSLYQVLQANLASRGVVTLHLSKSFRSVLGIQQVVNAAFAPEMTGSAESAQADYVPLEEHRGDIEGQPAVVALPVPIPEGAAKHINRTIDEGLPPVVTGMVEWLLRESDWKVADPELGGALRPVKPRDICLLFRRLTNWKADVTRNYVRGLEDRGIPHLLVGSKTFHWREEIETMRAALAAIEWPDDELSVFATLKGALLAVPDHVLLRFRYEHGALDPFRQWPEDLHPDYEPVRDALLLLAELHRMRNERPVAETVYKLLESVRAWPAFAFRPAGNQVLANVRRVVDMARQFESTVGLSFRGFVQELAAQAERGDSMEAAVVEEGADGVRLMTVHAAKGLEFPIVILADITANLTREEADRYVESSSGLCAMRLVQCSPLELIENEASEKAKEQAEGVRVAYVAATRARDVLIVPVAEGDRGKSWIGPLHKAVGPGNAMLWDVSVLPASQEEHFGKRQQEIFSEDPAALAIGLAEHAAWQQQRTALLGLGTRPAVSLLQASVTQELPAVVPLVRLERVPRQSGRPSGKRFGALVHNVLARVPLDAARAQVESTVALQARLLGCEEEERAAAVFAVRNALAHPLVERARAAGRLHREYPLTFTASEGRVVEGVIDLAFVEDGAWHVVDFKSDAELEGLAERYKAQLAWYAQGLRSLTAMPVHCYLLAV